MNLTLGFDFENFSKWCIFEKKVFFIEFCINEDSKRGTFDDNINSIIFSYFWKEFLKFMRVKVYLLKEKLWFYKMSGKFDDER